MNKLGFGFLRLPKLADSYDWETVCSMVDVFLEKGGRYFDTCYTYLDGDSENGIRLCLTQRHERSDYMLADKIPGYLCKSQEDYQRYLDASLRRCGIDWFDVLMLHWLNEKHYAIAEKYRQFHFLSQKKAEGIAKRIGFSYHGDAALLERILAAHPEVDVVLLQINYLDWESEGIQSRLCYEACLRHGKQIVVMEPVKGGTPAKLPTHAERLLRNVHPGWTPADWALRFVQSLPGVEICLSGMAAPEQVAANIRPFQPLTPEENALLLQAAEQIRGSTAIACTGCGYCLPHCPQHIPIPQYFRLFNELCRDPEDDWKILPSYQALAQHNGQAAQCLSCGSCQRHCPQNLPISTLMPQVAEKMEP